MPSQSYATESQYEEIVAEYQEDESRTFMDQDERFDLAFDHAMVLMPEDTEVEDLREIAYEVLVRTGKPYQHRPAENPLPSWHLGDREPYESLVADTCGCSAKTAAAIVAAHPSGAGLRTASVASLRHLGATTKQADRLASAFRLSRFVEERVARRPIAGTIRQPDDVSVYLRANIAHLDVENFVALYLDARQRVIDTRVVAQGSLSQVEVHPRELFADAIRLRAHSIILAHNHPSGDQAPSDADKLLTTRMAEVGQTLGIPVLDHIVVGRNARTGAPQSTSMAALGWVPSR